MEKKVITVTSPLLPSLDDFIPNLQFGNSSHNKY